MLPESLLLHSLRGDELVPHLLGADDHPWLRVLIDEMLRFVGRPQRELDERLRRPLPCHSPEGKRKLAAHVICRFGRSRASAAVPPREARAALFLAAASLVSADGVGRSAPDRPAVVARIAQSFSVTERQLLDSLFADLPGERFVLEPSSPLSPVELGLSCNLALVQGFLFRSTSVRIALEGNARAIVRLARLRGLLCTASSDGDGERGILDLSGPFSLFRHTLLYGRRLAELIPLLPWCARFQLTAECVVRDRKGILRVASGDPIAPSREPRRYDSKLEERFARDFGRLTKDWDVLREPEPVAVGEILLFPDFALSHRREPERRWLLEIVGFWTPEYLREKLARYRRADIARLILCVDETLGCAESELPTQARVVRFRRRIDPAEVLRAISTDG